MVDSVEETNGRVEISLKKNSDPQELLKALVNNVSIRAFEIKIPSLHEIFIHLVGEENE